LGRVFADALMDPLQMENSIIAEKRDVAMQVIKKESYNAINSGAELGSACVVLKVKVLAWLRSLFWLSICQRWAIKWRIPLYHVQKEQVCQICFLCCISLIVIHLRAF